MSKKVSANFTDQCAKNLIKKQKIKDEKRKIREEYLAKKYEEAEILTNDIKVYIESLNNIININPNVISIEEFIKKDIDDLPKELLVEYEKPVELPIRKAKLIEKIFEKQKQKYNLYVQQENEKYEKEYKIYEENENNRKNKIKAYNLQVDEIIKSKKELYKNSDTTLVSDYKSEILNQVQYPFKFEKCINTGYCRESKKLVIDYLLPNTKIVPDIIRYEYKKVTDSIKPIPINEKDKNNIYNKVVYSIVLNTMKNIFEKDKYNNIETIIFNGYINDVDLATGQDIKPYIISAMVDKDTFNTININRVDKLTCLKETMKARIDINSNLSLKSIIPICKYENLNKSVVNDESINLLEIDPFMLEDLVSILFRNMGYEVLQTNKTNDGGIDCILNHDDPIVGGKIIAQIKRYRNNIDIPKLREFESVLRNSDAMKGIFISTSNFSSSCEKFASDNNISLINGNLLVDYFNQYGINSHILNK